jgi:ankyrin repeat protein
MQTTSALPYANYSFLAGNPASSTSAIPQPIAKNNLPDTFHRAISPRFFILPLELERMGCELLDGSKQSLLTMPYDATQKEWMIFKENCVTLITREQKLSLLDRDSKKLAQCYRVILARLLNDKISDEECREVAALAEKFFSCLDHQSIKDQLNQVLADQSTTCQPSTAIFERLARVNLNLCVTLITRAAPCFEPANDHYATSSHHYQATGFYQPFAELYPTLAEQLQFKEDPAFVTKISRLAKLTFNPPSRIRLNNPRAELFFSQIRKPYDGTALHFALINGFTEVVPALLHPKGCVNLQNARGQTALTAFLGTIRDQPLDEDQQHTYLRVIHTLLDGGADPNLPDLMGNTALLYLTSSQYSQLSWVNALLDNQAELDPQDQLRGYSALMHAVENDAIEIVDALIQAGAKVNLQNKRGDTALMLAVKNNNSYLVEILLEAGADIALENEEGYTAIRYAQGQDSIEIENILHEKMAELAL